MGWDTYGRLQLTALLRGCVGAFCRVGITGRGVRAQGLGFRAGLVFVFGNLCSHYNVMSWIRDTKFSWEWQIGVTIHMR